MRNGRSGSAIARYARDIGRDQWRLDPLFPGGGRAWQFAAVALDLADPDTKAVWRPTRFARDRRQRGSLARIFGAELQK